MKHKILFEEQQQFKQWWVWLVLGGINAVFLYGIYRQVIKGIPFGNQPMSDSGLLFSTGIVILISILFRKTKLETRIAEDGLYVRFFPFHLRYTHISWSDIKNYYLRKYSAPAEFGGWGIRTGWGKGRAYTVDGNQGLQLELHSGKKLLIGTQKPEEMDMALLQLEKRVSRI